MGPTWKSLVAVGVGLAAVCSAHGQPVPFLAATDARACLMLSYSVVPQPASQSVRPGDPRITDADRTSATSPPDTLGIVAYVAGLEILLAVMAAVACLLALAFAGFAVRRQRRPESIPAPGSLRDVRDLASFVGQTGRATGLPWVS
jgi:hypothetical protein